MALFQISYHSNVLGKQIELNVILPEAHLSSDTLRRDKDGKWPMVMMLHGYTGNHTLWLRRTAIELYAQEHGIAVIMPDAGKSFYTDMVHGERYMTYIAEEVPEQVRQWFPVTRDPEHTYIAGLSMGGYGAMKIGLAYPDKFKAIGCFSGALMITQLQEEHITEDQPDFVKRLEVDLPLVYGTLGAGNDSIDDPFYLAKALKAKGIAFPELYISCGTEDFVYEQTLEFTSLLDTLEVPYERTEEAEDHNWRYWNREIDRFFSWALAQPLTD